MVLQCEVCVVPIMQYIATDAMEVCSRLGYKYAVHQALQLMQHISRCRTYIHTYINIHTYIHKWPHTCTWRAVQCSAVHCRTGGLVGMH